MATDSSILAWEVLWTQEPGRLQVMGPQSQTRLSDLVAVTVGQLFGNKVTK